MGVWCFTPKFIYSSKRVAAVATALFLLSTTREKAVAKRKKDGCLLRTKPGKKYKIWEPDSGLEFIRVGLVR
jgi:hypothetical protein